jgi:hypothetical protein
MLMMQTLLQKIIVARSLVETRYAAGRERCTSWKDPRAVMVIRRRLIRRLLSHQPLRRRILAIFLYSPGLSTTPIPGALSLLLDGRGAELLGWGRKRKNAAAIAVA